MANSYVGAAQRNNEPNKIIKDEWLPITSIHSKQAIAVPGRRNHDIKATLGEGEREGSHIRLEQNTHCKELKNE